MVDKNKKKIINVKLMKRFIRIRIDWFIFGCKTTIVYNKKKLFKSVGEFCVFLANLMIEGSL
jgi:hypothetical protein